MYSLTILSGSAFELQNSSANDNCSYSNTLPSLLILIHLNKGV